MTEYETQAEQSEQTDATPPPTQTAGDQNGNDAVQRADALMNDVGMRLGTWAAIVQHQARRFTTRTREEFEDVWAEAQALRQQGNSTVASGRLSLTRKNQSNSNQSSEAAPSTANGDGDGI